MKGRVTTRVKCQARRIHPNLSSCLKKDGNLQDKEGCVLVSL